MNLFAKQNIPPPGSNDILFRISLWRPLISLLIFLVGALVGVALFIYSYQASITWGMVLSGIYNLIMWGICHILFRTVTATLSPANWLTRISSGGILLKYRSYLHDDSPEEDPIALHLAWHEIADVQLQQEIHSTIYIDEKRELRRWFLSIKLDSRYINAGKINSGTSISRNR